MLTREVLWRLSVRELAGVLAAGHAIDLEALQGNYRGVSLGLPAIVERMTWKTFRKTFRRDKGSGKLVGHNVRMRQTGVFGPSEPERRNGDDVTFGPYEVVELPSSGTPFRCRAGVLLDYGARHPAWHPLARVRDPLVAVNVSDATLLLGATYLALGALETRTPSFFSLEREPV
jgi:hypothetical protein